MQDKNQLRVTIDAIDAELAQLAELPVGTVPPSLLTELLDSWARLVALLSLGRGPRIRPCPRCAHPVVREAPICAHCWTRLRPTTTNEA